MTLCKIDGGHCNCQPDEGIPCQSESPDYQRGFSDAWQASHAAALDRPSDDERVAIARMMLENGYLSGHMKSQAAADDMLRQFNDAIASDHPSSETQGKSNG